MLHTNPILQKAAVQESTELQATATPEDVSAALSAAPDSRLEAVQEALRESTTRTVTSIQQLEAGAKSTQVASDVIASAISDITAANQITSSAKLNADLQAQNATIDAFEVGGGIDAQTQLMRELSEDNTRVEDILEERVELANEDRFGEGIGIIDKIVNRFNLRLTEDQLSTAVAKRDNTVSQISNTSAATESFARVNSLTKRTLNEGVIEANYKAIEAEGKIKGAEQEIQNIHSNANAMTSLMAADSRNASNLLQLYRLEGEQQERDLKAERMKFSREQMSFQREQWKVELPKAETALEQAELNLKRSKTLGPTQIAAAELQLKAANKRFDDQVTLENELVANVQRGQSLSGTITDSRDTILWGLRQTGEIGAKYDKLHELGGSDIDSLGLSPFEAQTNLNIVSPSGTIKATKITKVLDQITQLQIATYNKAGQKIPKDTATLQSDYNTTASNLMATFAADIKTGDTSNPFQAPPMSVLADMNSISSTAFYKKVIAPMNMKEVDAQSIMDAAVAGVRAKTITPEQAASGIEAIFDGAALYNNTLQGGFRRVGLPNQTTYNTQLTRPRTFFEDLQVSTSSVINPRNVASQIGLAIAGLADVSTTGSISASTQATADAYIEKYETKFFTVDLMDGTKVQEAIVKLLSGQKPTDLSSEPLDASPADSTKPRETNFEFKLRQARELEEQERFKRSLSGIR